VAPNIALTAKPSLRFLVLVFVLTRIPPFVRQVCLLRKPMPRPRG
jgi:hypothetical protein